MSDITIDPNGPLSYLLDKPAIKTPDNALGKDAFLKLLVAQMKYQNPMEPTDSTEFISQTAQFTLVEQMENMASSNADMLAGQLSATAASLVGKAVQWDASLSDDPESPGTGTVQGVRITADGPVLIVDGWDVPLARVTAFGEVPDPEGEFEQPDLIDDVEDVPAVDEPIADEPVVDEPVVDEIVEDTPVDVAPEPDPEAEPVTEPVVEPEPAPAA